MSEPAGRSSARLFFALWPDPEVVRALLPYRPRQGRAVPSCDWHLTLVFLGQVDLALLPRLQAGAAAIELPAFDLVLARHGHWRRSKVSWLAPLELPPVLAELQSQLATVARECGLALEDRPYAPHLTLARRAPAHPSVDIPPIPWRVTEFTLVRSLGGGTGSGYSVLERWALESV